MLKELTVKEALTMLAEKYPEPIDCYCWDRGCHHKTELTGVVTDVAKKFVTCTGGYYHHCEIEVPDKYRYMTQQECLNWVCLHGIGYQVKEKNKQIWIPAAQCYFVYASESYQYRTISLINGSIVYGESQEFKVKVGV